MSDAEFASTLELPADRRYEYSIKRAADWRRVWSLRDSDGWALTSDAEGNTLVPIWPHPRLAEASAVDAWSNMQPTAIELDALMGRWLPGIEGDRRKITVFPLPAGVGPIVSAARLRDDLAQELANYE